MSKQLPLWRKLYVQVFAAIIIGIVVGAQWPKTGAGFVTLAATLIIAPDIPMASLGLLLGVDRFMSQCRAATNFISNGVVTLAVARWEKELNHRKLTTVFALQPEPVTVL